jgi:tetratricopeptide (TPR) repeat protein
MRRLFLLSFLACASALPAAGLRAQGAAPPAAADAGALADSVQRAATGAYLRGDREGVRAARMFAERALAVHPNDPMLLHQAGYALYREALQAAPSGAARERSAEETRAMRELLDRAVQMLEKSASLRRLPETHALLGAIYGRKAGLVGGMGAMEPGMRAGSELERAVEMGPENPRVWLLQGTNALFTPAMWGGGDDKALEALQKAVQLFGADAQRAPLPTWGRAEAHAWLGMVHQRRRDYERARAAFNEALRLEPSYAWVRTVLLPRLEQSQRSR